MTDLIWYTLSGAAVGFVVGMTGVGGGSFMTPILLSFGIPPATAVGTDLLYAAITKSGGVITHARQKTIDWKVVGYIAAGSIPASFITIYILLHLQAQAFNYGLVLKKSLGFMLVITSAVLLFRTFLIKERDVIADANSKFGNFERRHIIMLSWIMGVFLGTFVTLTSVGAGAFGAAVLMILYPLMPIIRVIGTDLAHAVPLTAVAGLGHMHLGNVDLKLLASLIIGSLPAIWLGTKLANHIPERIFQPLMAIILLSLGIKYIIS